ncbi:MAG: NosD domain-containing protein, partial [Phycisphaerales bacterium]
MHISVLSAFRAVSVSTLAIIAFGLSAGSAFARQATDCVTGANHVTSANTTTQIFTALGFAAADPADPANAGCTLCGVPVTATATGMSAAQLSLLGNNAPYIAANGVSGTFTITNGVSDAPLGNLLGKVCLDANVTVNASGMTNAQLDQLVANIARIDTITNLAAGKTLTLAAAEAGGKIISGAGTVAIKSDALGTSADLTQITTAGLTFPTTAPFFSVGTGGLLSLYPERASGYTIEGTGTVSLVGTVDFDVTIKDISATVSLDADGVTGTSIALGKTFTLTAAQANGQTIAGTGTTSVFGNIAANANFTLIASLLNIPGSVDANATLTLTAAQGDGRTLTGAGSTSITTAALSANTNFRGLTTAGFAFSGSIASDATLSINAAQHGITVSGLGTVDILGTAGNDTVTAANITAVRTISTLAGADSLAGGATADTLNGGSGDDTVAGAAGIDTAVYAGSCVGAISGSSTLSITTTEDGTDGVTGVERLTFSDANILVVNRAGSEYTTLDQVLALGGSDKLFGTFTVTSASFTDAASLDALIARILSGSTVSVNVLGMNAGQLTAVAASAASFQPITYPPVQVVSGATITGYFSTIQAAINFATAGDVVNVSAGTYAENITIAKAVDVRGPNYAVSPNGGTRVAEAVLVPASTNTSSGAVVTITSSGVSFRGFTVDGDNAALAASGVGLGGALGTSIDAARCVFLQGNGLNGVTLSKNIAKNSVNGLRIEQTTNYFATTAGALRSTNILLDDNLVQDMTGTGIRLGNSMYAKVTNNTVTNADNGIAFSSFRISDAGSAADRVIQGNTISARYAGIWVNLFHASPYALVNNTITVAAAATSMAPTPQNRTAWYGIMYSTVSAPQNFANQVSLPLVATPEWWTATGNTIDGVALESTSTGHGYWLYYVDNNRDSAGNDHFGQISGGSVSNVAYGIMLKNKDTDPATNFGNSAVGAHAAVSGVAFSLNAGGTGFRLIDDSTWVTGNPAPLVNKRNVQLAVGAGNSITGGATGVSVTQPFSFAQADYNPIAGGSVSDLAFSGQSGDYILLAMNKAVDATSATFGGKTGATATLAQNYDIEDK